MSDALIISPLTNQELSIEAAKNEISGVMRSIDPASGNYAALEDALAYLDAAIKISKQLTWSKDSVPA